jgi:hypothetical protein
MATPAAREVQAQGLEWIHHDITGRDDSVQIVEAGGNLVRNGHEKAPPGSTSESKALRMQAERAPSEGFLDVAHDSHSQG